MEQKYVIAYTKEGRKNFFLMLHTNQDEVSPRCSYVWNAQHFTADDIRFIRKNFKKYWDEHELCVHRLKINLGEPIFDII